MGQARLDLTGQKFNMLTVLAPAGLNKRGATVWLCRCDCGREKVFQGGQVKGGYIKCCGCVRAKRVPTPVCDNPAHGCWSNMVQRCTNPKSTGFHRYGGRGVTLCDEWRTSFSAFLAHIGPRPSARHSINRIDNDRGYEPGNVCWATQTEQMRNFSQNRLITAFGKTKPVAAWAEEYGLAHQTLDNRINTLGWDVERAISEPAKPRRQRNVSY